MGITGDEVKALITQMKTLIDAAQQGNFDWNLPESDQGDFEFKMMALLWFKNDFSFWKRKRMQLDIQQMLNVRPVTTRGCHVRATLEISPDTRPWNKARATRDIAQIASRTI